MQRIDQKEKSIILIEKIKKDYFEPFIISLKNSKLNELQIIQEILCCLQMEVADSYHYFFQLRNQKCELLYNFDATVRRESLKPLILHPALKGNFIRLGMLYLEEDKQKKEFPNSDSVEIQTCIRELFYNYINPLPKMKIKYSNTSLSFSKSPIKNNGLLFNNVPGDIQQKIYSYLDYESLFSLKQTCQSAYFLNKKMMQTQNPIFYLIAGEVKITRPRKWHEFDLEYALRDEISQNEIITSLHQVTKNKNNEVRIFQSLYQALEYTQFLQHGGSVIDGGDDGFIPSLWVVNVPNAADLSFTQDKIILNVGASCSAYEGNRRDASVSYAMMSSDAVQPILGTVVFSLSDFASYKTFNRVNMLGYQNEQESSSRNICSIQ